MKKREFLKVAGTVGGASVLGALPFPSSAQSSASFAVGQNTTGKARAIEHAFMIGTNIQAGKYGFGFIFTKETPSLNGVLLDNSDEVQPIFAKRTDIRVFGHNGELVYLWVEFDPITQAPVEGGMQVTPDKDSLTGTFVRKSGSFALTHKPEDLKRAIRTGQAAKAMLGSLAVEFTSQFAGQLISRLACVYVPGRIKAVIEKLAGEETAEAIINWVDSGVGVTSATASFAYSTYMTVGLSKWVYQNPHRMTTPMGILGVLLYLAPPLLSMFSAVLPHIPSQDQNRKVIPPNVAAVWAASYGRSSVQTLLKEVFPEIKVPPIIRVWHSNSQLIMEFDTPQLAIKWLVAFTYYGTTYGIGAASAKIAAEDIFRNSEILGVIPLSTLSAAAEGIDGAVSALANSFHPSAQYVYNDRATLEKAAANLKDLRNKFGAWAFHRDVASRVLNINTGFINYFLEDNTDVSFYGVSATSNIANALVAFRKVWLLLAETALNPTAAAAPSYGPHELISAVSYSAMPSNGLFITNLNIQSINQQESFSFRTDRELVTTVTVETPIEWPNSM